MNIIKSIVIFSIFILTGCKDEALLTGIDQTQANEVIALLQKNNIYAEKKDLAKSGYLVLVSRDDFVSAVDLINVYNLPSKSRVEVSQMFPEDSLISSPRAEVARIYSAIEQRLEQTLNQMDGVVSSRVHVSYDVSNTEAEKNQKPVHIAVLLRHNRENVSDASLIADSKRLLKNTFSNVVYDDISVVLTPAPELQLKQPVSKKKSNVNGIMIGALIGLFIAGILVGVFFLLKKRKGVTSRPFFFRSRDI